jgi:predicted secreted hydrolase
MRARWSITGAVLAAWLLAVTTPAASFRSAAPGYRYHFPADHGVHEEFRTEWWYYTGQLTSARGRQFGFQLTFFRRAVEHESARTNPSRWALRTLYFAHLALSDLDHRQFYYAEKISRTGLGKAGAEAGRLRVWIDRWMTQAVGDSDQQQLNAEDTGFGIELLLTPEKAPVVHGEQGISRKGSGPEEASHYYSITRLATTGTVRLGQERLAVTGLSWMDHEFGSADLPDGLVGWDWFSVQLDDGRDLMLYLLRREDGTPHPSSSGTAIAEHGRAQSLRLSDFSIQVAEHWVSPHSGARYPSRWRISVPALDWDLEVSPLLADQELRTNRSTQVTYWEGAVRVSGTARGMRVDGQGYVELTGYAGRLRRL